MKCEISSLWENANAVSDVISPVRIATDEKGNLGKSLQAKARFLGFKVFKSGSV